MVDLIIGSQMVAHLPPLIQGNPTSFGKLIMDANSTHTTNVCSCGVPPSEWQLLEDTVKKGPL